MAHGDVTHLEIPVTDFAAATDFYGKVFGWQIAEVPGFDDYPMWQGAGGVSGGALVRRDDTFTQPRSTVVVDSIDDTLSTVTAGGGTVVTSKTEITPTSWFAVFDDPDGNTIGLFEGSMQ